MRESQSLKSLKALTINGENDIPGKEDSKDCIESENCEFDSGNVARFAYCLILMGSFWISECVPIAVTALFPYFLFPLFGLASGKPFLRLTELNSSCSFKRGCKLHEEHKLYAAWWSDGCHCY